MIHKGCGGKIVEDVEMTYIYEGESIPALFCQVCGVEIVGDPQVFLREDEMEKKPVSRIIVDMTSEVAEKAARVSIVTREKLRPVMYVGTDTVPECTAEPEYPPLWDEMRLNLYKALDHLGEILRTLERTEL